MLFSTENMDMNKKVEAWLKEEETTSRRHSGRMTPSFGDGRDGVKSLQQEKGAVVPAQKASRQTRGCVQRL
jgi:hypothetical protein